MKISKPVRIALDVFGGLCVVALVYFAGTCAADRANAQPARVVQAAESSESHAATDSEPATSGSVQEDEETGWTEQEVLLGKLAINEASGRDADTVAIVLARRGRSVEWLLAHHTRALAEDRNDGRAWIAGLNAELTKPDAWNEAVMPWADGRRVWLRTLQLVRRTLERGGRCEGGVPQIWGGRRLDSHHIERRLEQGFRIVNCGDTANVFMRR